MGSIMDATILHHVCIVLISLWLLNTFDYCHGVTYFIAFIYLYLVHEGYVMKLRKKIKFEEKRDANQRRVLLESETVRWLNYAVEKMWLVCMEEIVSQKILLPIAPWFLKKYKPWTVKEIEMQNLYLGRCPPIFTEMKVLLNSNSDDHLVLETGINFCTADDMSAIIGVKLRKRLGFGMWAKLHLLGLHIEGRVLVGVKFLRRWPFIGRLRVCFTTAPYFQMTVKPIFSHGLDVTEVPGIAGWIDNLLAHVFEETLVEPNMLVVDVEKYVSPQPENWFTIDAKEPIAHAVVEVLEGAEMKSTDLNGLADPYVMGQLGPFSFRTKIQRKTLAPKWLEEFKIPICSWDSRNILVMEVRDKDRVFDDIMGDCCVNVNDFRDGHRHDMWLPLQNIKIGRLHIAVTVVPEVHGKEAESIRKHAKDIGVKLKLKLRHGKAKFGKGVANFIGVEQLDGDIDHMGVSFEAYPTPACFEMNSGHKNLDADIAQKGSISPMIPEESPKVPDKFEPVNVEGQKVTGVWIHRPGSDVAQVWEPRPGKGRHIDAHNLKGEASDSVASSKSADGSGTDESMDQQPKNRVRQGLRKIGSIFQKGPKGEDDENEHPDQYGPETPHGNVKVVAKTILKQAGKSAKNLKSVLSRKRTNKYNAGPRSLPTVKDSHLEDISDDESSSSSLTDTAPEEGGMPVHVSAVFDDSIEPLKSKDEIVLEETLSAENSGDNSFVAKESVILEPRVLSDSSFKSVEGIAQTDAVSGDHPSMSRNKSQVINKGTVIHTPQTF